ncbi:protein PUTATIVE RECOMBINATION INITIATION DEFECT 1 [Humulus lupulus]|uniref:protein PUTATIVE RECOMBINATION INITIATION DEFECT 1 n=1 Tax=Humulus lupulus TaxID=3486 RepID=UPI002B41377B|nr:protein PUTATIVE RECOMBINATION INITIATION DEFECT 1 [Humulus lupulus]
MYFNDTAAEEELPDYSDYFEDHRNDNHRHNHQHRHHHQDHLRHCVSSQPPPLTTSSPPSSCSQGHRSSMILHTNEGGSICLICFSNLISEPHSPTLHVSYALSQLSIAISQPPFLRSLLSFHPLLLVSPLVSALSSFDDAPLALQIVDLVAALCASADSEHSSVHGSFVARVSDRLSSGALCWSRRQVYMLHCLGVLLKFEKDDLYAHIKDKYYLVSNLVGGLQLPSDEIRGEIFFVLYRLCLLQDGDGDDILSTFCPKLLHLSLEALVKTQVDDVRLNCVALLTVLARRGLFGNAFAVDTISLYSNEADSLMQAAEDGVDGSHLNVLFAEAIKGPLLSTDSRVQIGTVNLLIHYMASEGTSSEQIQVLVEENIADYVFEILRLSDCKDPVVNSCLQVLDLLSSAKQAFKQRLVVGFSTLIPVLQYVAEIPFHPVQSHTLKLIWTCISDCPGIPSASQIKEIVFILTRMLGKHAGGEIDILPETFTMACLIFVSLLKSPSSHGTLGLTTSIKEASQHAVLTCLSIPDKSSSQLLHSLYLLKEVYEYSHDENFADTSNIELRTCIVDICVVHLLPWFVTFFKEIEEETVLIILETFHSILIWDSDIQTAEFAHKLVSSSWFSLSFGCLGLFPTNKTKQKVYLVLSSLVDVILDKDSGQSIRDAASCLPSDPVDLLFLLRQRSSNNLDLSSSQSAILTILFASSLYDERLADDKLILASLEEYIFVNGSNFQRRVTDSSTVMRLLYLYSFYRGLAKVSYQIQYSPEAERILFQLVNDFEWDLVSARIHPIALKWMFQQEKCCELLSDQILKFCGSSISHGSDITFHEKNPSSFNVQALAELVASGDNYGARILTCLLMKLVKEEVEENYLISLVNLLTRIVNVSPAASDELFLNNIGNALYTLYSEKNLTFSSEISTPLLVLIFNILSSVHSETLSDDEIWLAVIMKLMDYFISSEPARNWTQNNLIVIGILSLILNHSTSNALIEASKSIFFNSSLISTIDSIIHEACLKGPALVDHDEGSSYGEHLVYVLLLSYFSLRSLHAVLPGSIDWQSFFDPPDRTQPLSVIGIPCHDLCRLIYFGSPQVKLVTSYCLLELFTRISDERNREGEELKCTIEYLMSVITVLEGLVFYSDNMVAVNCSLCLSMIIGCETLNSQDTSVAGKNNWSRLIVEELAVSMSAPCLASKSFVSEHKAAVYVAVALIKLEKIPVWLRSVFDDHCISGIVENLRASNVTSEIVVLFQELLNSEFLKEEHIASLSRVFQACRKRLYTDNTNDERGNEHIKKVSISMSHDLGKVCEYLTYLMSSQDRYHRNKSLLDEIESFFRTLTIE